MPRLTDWQPVIGQHMAHALARALAPQRDDDALAGRLQRLHVRGRPRRTRWRRCSVRSAAKLRPCRAPTSTTAPPCSGTANGVSRASAAVFSRSRPFGFGRDRAGPAAAACRAGRPRLRQRVLARLVVVGDLREPLARGVLGQRLEDHRRARHIVEQRVEPVVEQRQPVLHAGMAAAFAHRLVEQVVADRRRRRPRHSRCGICGSCRW